MNTKLEYHTKAPDMTNNGRVASDNSELLLSRCKKNDYPEGSELLMKDGDGQSMHVLKMCYRKHVLDDQDIGWDELCDDLCDVLAQTMGDEKFQEWLKAL